MIVHARLNVPHALSAQVRELLIDDARVTNVSIYEGASLRPAGDVIEVDIAREAASDFLDEFERLGLAKDGGILLDSPLGAPFAAADEVDREAHGDPDDAVIWRLVERKAEESSHATANYLTFLVIATALASIAVLTDSAVLVVGAMVVGPEFAAVAAVCTGVVLGSWRLVKRAAWLLIWTFVVAIAIIAVISWAGMHLGFFEASDLSRPRPQTDFIWRPDKWSFIVALWAGAAGVLAQSIDKTNAMVGVFISVTTVPAAGNLALGLAALNTTEMTGSAAQLGLNLAGMILAGTVTLVAQRAVWRRLSEDRRFLLVQRHTRQSQLRRRK